MSRYSDPPTVYAATAYLLDVAQNAWDAWEERERGQTHVRRQLEH